MMFWCLCLLFLPRHMKEIELKHLLLGRCLTFSHLILSHTFTKKSPIDETLVLTITVFNNKTERLEKTMPFAPLVLEVTL